MSGASGRKKILKAHGKVGLDGFRVNLKNWLFFTQPSKTKSQVQSLNKGAIAAKMNSFSLHFGRV
jgi:hypothetical protein